MKLNWQVVAADDVYATVRYELGGLSFDAKFRPGNWLSFDVAVEANAPYWWFEQQVLELATETDGLPVAEVGARGEAAREFARRREAEGRGPSAGGCRGQDRVRCAAASNGDARAG